MGAEAVGVGSRVGGDDGEMIDFEGRAGGD